MRSSPGVTRRLLLDLVVRGGPTHRADLARRLGVSRTTVTNVVTDLEAANVLVTEGDDDSQIKRPVSLARGTGIIVSAILMHDKVAVALGMWDGTVIAYHDEPLVSRMRGAERLEVAHDLIVRTLKSQNISTDEVSVTHLAVNAQCDSETGDVHTSSVTHEWNGVNPHRTALSWDLGPVVVENTARLVGLAEYFDSGKSRRDNLIYLHLSWGITLGQVVDGQIIGGAHGGAGEIGHVASDDHGVPCECGRRGCLVQYVGIVPLKARLEPIMGRPLTTTEDFVTAWTDECHSTDVVIADAALLIGDALANVCNLLDPAEIVLGGEVSLAGEPFRDAVDSSLKKHALPLAASHVRVSLGSCYEHPNLVASAAISRLRMDPQWRARAVDALLVTVEEAC